MKQKRCPHEDSVLSALNLGELNRETQRHIETCQLCQEHLLVGRALNEYAHRLTENQKIPDYGLVWLKKQFRERQEAPQKIVRPLVVSQILSGIVAGLILLGVIWLSPSQAPELSGEGFSLSLIMLKVLPFAIVLPLLLITLFLTGSAVCRDD